MLSEEKINSYLEHEPLLKKVMKEEPVIWLNKNRKSMATLPPLTLHRKDMDTVTRLWKRFAPYLMKVFPDTKANQGAITSPLKEVSQMKAILEKQGAPIPGRLFVKCDSDLAVAGSIKARGGFYEVLHYAERLAINAGLVTKEDNYEIFDSAPLKKLFSQYKIGVGSTGNLGMSIGIISAQLGFQATVYVSGDAKQWKKDLLRSKGAKVEEFEGDFSEAILAGRQKTLSNPMGYFVDDENSNQLYIGYSVGALELQRNLQDQGIVVDQDHPLFVYSPCGVGGSSGGIAFGLRQIYGDAVHSFFVEPTHAPAVLIGLATGEMSNICVQDLGIDNKTEADGLAVGRSSNFATRISSHLISGVLTIEDYRLYQLLADLWDSEKIFLEPSATAGLIGPQMVATSDYAQINGIDMTHATHIAWATGGALVPQKDRDLFYQTGKR